MEKEKLNIWTFTVKLDEAEDIDSDINHFLDGCSGELVNVKLTPCHESIIVCVFWKEEVSMTKRVITVYEKNETFGLSKETRMYYVNQIRVAFRNPKVTSIIEAKEGYFNTVMYIKKVLKGRSHKLVPMNRGVKFLINGTLQFIVVYPDNFSTPGGLV